jgi:hypothetical protein
VKTSFAINRIFLAGCFLAPFLWIFGEAIFTSRSFVFRDAAHYYHPLFEWTAGEWRAGRIPLWNPWENCGTPALADPTTSVFYPGKLVFALPLDYATRYKIYILAHVLLAGGAACFTARRWRASPAAATACGLSYAFGGSVVFQYCNVVYLVGAAWLPLAFWTIDGLLRQCRWSWAMGLAAVLAMMVLGGDPQIAYHAGLAALLAWRLRQRHGVGSRFRPLLLLFGWLLGRKRLPTPSSPDARVRPSDSRWRLPARHRLTLLAGAALFAGCLAAVQILPAQGWTARSERAAFDQPRSIYEIPAWLMRDGSKRVNSHKERPPALAHAIGRLVAPPAPGTHHEQVYQFSVGPWRWSEFVWPNFSGRLFPVHRRWISALPAEGRTWTPSLYFGLAPLVAALAAWRLRGGPTRVRWLSWTVLLSLLAALGWYGLGWLWIELRYALWGENPDTAVVGAPTGGLYWLLANLLPEYAYFRYPAKWLTVASLAASLLAARGWDVAFTGQSRRAARGILGVGILSLAGLLAWIALRPQWMRWVADAPADDLFGPLDKAGAARDVWLAFLHTALLALLLGIAARRRRDSESLSLAPLLIVPLTALDLSLAHGWVAPTAPREIWRRTPRAAQVIADDASQGAIGGIRVSRASQSGWLPREWTNHSSSRRQVEGLVWDHASLYPKYHLRPKVALVETQGSLAAADYTAFLDVGREHGLRRPDGVREPAPELLKLLGAGYVLLPRDVAFRGGERVVASLGPGDLSNIAIWRNPAALPRAWIVHRVERLPELTAESPAALRQRTREALRENGRWRDFRREAVIETDADLLNGLTPHPSASGPLESSHTCRLLTDEPVRIEIEVNPLRPGLLVLSDHYNPGWRATYTAEGETTSRPLPILRTNRVLRGVWLPAGRGRVTFVYHPTRFYFGAAISIVGWLGWLALVATGWRRNRRSKSTR